MVADHLLAVKATAQSSLVNSSFPVKYFSPSIFQGHPQNWDVEALDNGKIYYANSGMYSGLISFDGIRWQQYPLTNNGGAFSLAKGTGDTLYIGGQKSIGFFAATETGEFKHHSYTRNLPDSLTGFSDVWFTHHIKGATYFNALSHLFLFENNKLRAFDKKSYFGYSFVTDDTVWVKKEDAFYKVIPEGDSLTFHKVPGTEPLAKNSTYAAIALNDSTLLFSQNGEPLYIYSKNSKKLSRFYTEIDGVLASEWIYNGLALSNGTFVLCSVSNGIYILNAEGELVEKVDRQDGLNNQEVYAVAEGDHGNIWLALNNGIAVVKPFSALNTFWEGNDFKGGIEDIEEFGGALFTATQQGVYKITDTEESQPSFDRISQAASQYMHIVNTGEELIFAGSNQGLKLLDSGSGLLRDLADLHAEFLHYIPLENLLIGGGRNGLFLFSKNEGEWKLLWLLDELPLNLRSVDLLPETVEGELLQIFAGSTTNGLWTFSLDLKDLTALPELKKVVNDDFSEGMNGAVETFILHGKVLVGTNDGLYDIEKSSEGEWTLSPSRLMQHIDLGLSNKPYSVFSNKGHDEVWVSAENRLVSFRISKEDTVLITPSPLEEVQVGYLEMVYKDRNGQIWLGGMDGLARYRKAENRQNEADFDTYISAVKINSDSMFYPQHQPEGKELKLPFSKNNIEVNFSSGFYHPYFTPAFAWRINTLHSDFTAWTKNSSAIFTNLPAGNYTLEVKSRNIFGIEGKPVSFSFTVLPPWYQSWWMLLIYFLSIIASVIGITYLRSRNLQQKKNRLESQVKERTQEVVRQKQQIEDLVDELRRVDALKSEYFANVSHEFRTPLTLMLNPIEDLLNSTEVELPSEWKQKLELVSRNTKRLKKLVDQILDLIKLEAGILKPDYSRVNLAEKTKVLVQSFESLAHSKGLSLSYSSNIKDDLWVRLDDAKYEHIVQNLLSNAIKFTSKGGTVKVKMKAQIEEIVLQVEDTGEGISEQDIPHIFNRFYKLQKQGLNQEGLGVGLALSLQLAHMLNGSLKVESTLGSGSVFTLRLPVEMTNPKEQIDLPVEKVHINEYRKEAPKDEPQKKPSRDKILIVEDNPDMRDYICSILKKSFNACTAADGKKALKKMEEEEPSLIISDIMMPEMDGFTYAKQVRKQSKYHNTPIIFLSARADVNDRLKGLRIGVEDYLVKPFNKEELLARVDNLLEKKRRILHFSQQDEEQLTATQSDEFLNQAKQIILEHISSQDFGVSRLADAIFISERQLQRKIKALTGCTSAEYIKLVKLRHARDLLEQKKCTSVREASDQVGYSNAEYFSRLFKQEFGRTPSSLL